MATKLRAFLTNESAATTMQYGLVAAGVAVAIMSVIGGFARPRGG